MAFSRLRDLDDWSLRKQRLTNMGPKGKGRGKGKEAVIEAPGGWTDPGAPAAIERPRRKAKAQAKAP